MSDSAYWKRVNQYWADLVRSDAVGEIDVGVSLQEHADLRDTWKVKLDVKKRDLRGPTPPEKDPLHEILPSPLVPIMILKKDEVTGELGYSVEQPQSTQTTPRDTRLDWEPFSWR